ncbi:ribokinase [Planctomonas sp. JC2975]|uniref:PfkB family carbohydrate kinase n=1 Tax=Planctomonas sp. JC2975 TaxID=2729626 RepID=UPI001473C0E8|nr:ribokinase [Planctomonas sp. JC2975]
MPLEARRTLLPHPVRRPCRAAGRSVQGLEPLEQLRGAHPAARGINTSWTVEVADCPTGTASITVDKHGENTILIDAGANAALEPDTLHAEQFSDASALLLTLEVPDRVLLAALRMAKAHSVPTILNLSPLRGHAPEILSSIDILIVNNEEFTSVASPDGPDVASTQEAANRLGPPVVVVTRGGQGAIVLQCASDERMARVPSVQVAAVDTTGCGDAFAGALAARLSASESLLNAARFAASYAALVATKQGAQVSYPHLAEYEAWTLRTH